MEWAVRLICTLIYQIVYTNNGVTELGLTRRWKNQHSESVWHTLSSILKRQQWIRQLYVVNWILLYQQKSSSLSIKDTLTATTVFPSHSTTPTAVIAFLTGVGMVWVWVVLTSSDGILTQEVWWFSYDFSYGVLLAQYSDGRFRQVLAV